jgi:type IX secretion system PorP/SprF family membrane protein
MFTGDNMGDGALASNTISGIYSYKFQASDNVNVSFGMQASYYQLKMDWNKYIFGDMIDPNTGSTTNPTNESPENWNENVSFVDFSAGVMAGYSDKFFAGLAVHHLTEPDNALNKNSESKLPMKITAHAGTQISLETGALGAGEFDELTISPNILYQQQQGFHQLNLGMYANIYPFVAGLWFRHNFENPDAAIVLLGFKQDKYKIGYSYDFTVSELGAKSGGAHEISFAWEFCIIREAVKRRKIKAIKSPTF